MKISQILTSAAFVVLASSHATVFNIYVNDVNQGLGNTAGGYIRSPPNNSPVKDITTKDIACNVKNVAAAKSVNVAAGDKITVEWHHDSNTAADDIIDGSHEGPVLVYIAPTKSNGAGDVWVKLAEEGFANGKWAVDNLRANGGKHSFTLPSVLAAGDYLIRAEIIALHESDTTFDVNPARGAQFYPSCIQLKVSGSGTTALPAGVAFPGAYSYADPGVHFNLYSSFTSYPIPGPAVWDAAASGGKAPVVKSKAPAASSTRTAVQSPISTPSTVKTTAPLTPVPTSAAPVVSSPAAPETTAPTTLAPSACKIKTTMITVTKPAPTGEAVGTPAISKWGRCGGKGYTGSTACAAGSTCQVQNPYYSQCL